jgi:hypothetical protein
MVSLIKESGSLFLKSFGRGNFDDSERFFYCLLFDIFSWLLPAVQGASIRGNFSPTGSLTEENEHG